MQSSPRLTSNVLHGPENSDIHPHGQAQIRVILQKVTLALAFVCGSGLAPDSIVPSIPHSPAVAGSNDILQEPVSEEVDIVEINHLYDENAQHVLDQVIYYEWDSTKDRFQVREWRLLKSAVQIPTRDVRGEKSSLWHDGTVLRRVTTNQVRETWTQYDPELYEREFLPKDSRRRFKTSPQLFLKTFPDQLSHK